MPLDFSCSDFARAASNSGVNSSSSSRRSSRERRSCASSALERWCSSASICSTLLTVKTVPQAGSVSRLIAPQEDKSRSSGRTSGPALDSGELRPAFARRTAGKSEPAYAEASADAPLWRDKTCGKDPPFASRSCRRSATYATEDFGIRDSLISLREPPGLGGPPSPGYGVAEACF
jgi:hypothetical protein